MNINASNPSLINILLQQASKSQEKKRPTFEQVFAKLNARTARMDANKNPMNNMLTNEQLFRYYVKETEPKLRVSDDSFNGDAVADALNPMRESNPNMVYGSGTTQTSDIIPSRNPYNNAENIGIPLPSNASISSGAPIQQPRMSASAPTAPTASAPVPVAVPDPLLGVVLREADDNYRDALAINNRLSIADYGSVSEEGQMLLKILFSDDYQDQSVYFMKMLIDGGAYENAVSGLFDIFYQTRLNKPMNNFIVNKIAGIVGAEFSYGPAVKQEFDKLYNPNNVSQQEFLQNIAKKINASASFTDAEKARMDRELGIIDNIALKDVVGKYLTDTEKTYYDLYGRTAVRNAIAGDPTDPVQTFNRAVAESETGPNIVNSIFNDLLDELFFDGDTELRSNTDINSSVLDPELAKKLADRNLAMASASSSSMSVALTAPSSSPTSKSSTMAEAGSGEVDIDNVINRRPRGVQPGSVRGPYATPKNIAQDILGDIIGEAVSQGETRKQRAPRS